MNTTTRSADFRGAALAAEQALLGGLLMDSGQFPRVAALVAARDFGRDDHRVIFTAMGRLAALGKPFDHITLATELEDHDELVGAGGLGYLGTLVRETPTAATVANYAAVVRERAIRRALMELAEDWPDGQERLDRLEGLLARFKADAPLPPAGPMLHGVDFADMQPHLADGYLIKELFGQNGLAAIIGPSSSGKTFCAAELAVHIAANRPWRGRRIAGGLVIYAALEGPVSAENRFVAARASLNLPAGIPLRLTAGPINLRDPVDVALLIEFVKRAEADHGQKCSAIFIDTLSRAMAGGDENGSEHMGALVVGADAVRLATGATVILVHHLGKDETRGARGHSCLKAALDTEVEITNRDGLRIATVTKQRDLPSGDRFAFRLASVVLGRDADGDAVTSCTVEHVETPAPGRERPSGKNQGALLGGLEGWKREHPDTDVISSIDLREIAKAKEIDRKRVPEAIEGLTTLGYLAPCVGGFKFQPEASS